MSPKLLYLSFAWPPGLQALYPDLNPAGHAFEIQMTAALRDHFELRTTSVLPFAIPSLPSGADPASGLNHDLILTGGPPELWHRCRAISQLKRHYQRWQAEGWRPDALLVYNLSPIYNQFIRWLRLQPNRPRLVLLLLDSSQLGAPLPLLKRLRYRFKPFTVLDEQMLDEFDACIGLSTGVEKYSAARKQPFLWMPGGCAPGPAFGQGATDAESNRPIRLGYFGALAPHSGVLELATAFLQVPGNATLHICGYGKLSETLAAMAQENPRIHFGGLLPTAQDCLRFGQSGDVLVNPRPPSHGNENNFPSKVFQYALCGRAILATRMSGVDQVLGPETLYFEPASYEASLRRALAEAVAMPRAELWRRGERIRARVIAEYSWKQQALRIKEFIYGL